MIKVNIDFWDAKPYRRLLSRHANKWLFTMLNMLNDWMDGETTVLFTKLQVLYMKGGWSSHPSWSPTLLRFCDLVAYYSKPVTLSIIETYLPENSMPHLSTNLTITSLTLDVGIKSYTPSLSLPNLQYLMIQFENTNDINPFFANSDFKALEYVEIVIGDPPPANEDLREILLEISQCCKEAPLKSFIFWVDPMAMETAKPLSIKHIS